MHIIDPAHGSPSSQRATIVVLDPSPVSLLTVAGVLDSQGYGCICARTGSAAIEALSMGTVDLLLCDVTDDAAAALEHPHISVVFDYTEDLASLTGIAGSIFMNQPFINVPPYSPGSAGGS